MTSPPPPPPYYGPPPGSYPGGPAGPPQNTQGLVGMILGIASIPLICCCIGIPLGIAGAIVSWLGLQKANQGLATNRGQAMAGLICGAIGAVLGIILWAILFATGNTHYYSTFSS